MHFLTARSVPLTAAEKWTFFEPNGHLAYRRTMLLLHRHLIDQGEKKSGTLIVALEASFVAIRVFIQFLGLGSKHSGSGLKLVANTSYPAFAGHSHEVKVKDLGGKFVDPNSLPPHEAEELAKFYDGVSKATAHLTFASGHQLDLNRTHDVVKVVDRLLKSHLYDVTGEIPYCNF